MIALLDILVRKTLLRYLISRLIVGFFLSVLKYTTATTTTGLVTASGSVEWTNPSLGIEAATLSPCISECLRPLSWFVKALVGCTFRDGTRPSAFNVMATD